MNIDTASAGRMLLNCDMGESFGAWVMGTDEQVMPVIDMANIACGFHASDPDVMAHTISLAVTHQVRVGAHPGYADKQGFGRRSIPHTSAAITHLVLYQYGALQALCQQVGTHADYIKPHGALYHDMMHQPRVFQALLQACTSLPDKPALVIQAGNHTHYQQQADHHGIALLYEAFADRAYQPDGSLMPRSQPGAIHHDPVQICTQARQIAHTGTVTTCTGTTIPLKADTLCVHGDNATAATIVQDIKTVLKR